jgi:hypothetical protein
LDFLQGKVNGGNNDEKEGRNAEQVHRGWKKKRGRTLLRPLATFLKFFAPFHRQQRKQYSTNPIRRMSPVLVTWGNGLKAGYSTVTLASSMMTVYL